MSGLLLAIALVAAPLQETQAEEADDIVVIGKRLGLWRGSFRIVKDKVRCKTRQSTGDRAIDAIGCDALVQCAGMLAPRLAATDTPALEPSVQATMKADVQRELGECVFEKRRDGIADLARRRAEARRSAR
ncbi:MULTISPECIES: hypothetical protein [unclassified Sphingomonas]|jgi:hypothetical protein|uniref:hypothetical protein n=1 Tax=unclassified Sphingomonas TaxID=196159 RepID=UPI00083591D9|nr:MULTISPECIES: hypothetical protein [unclassified Sphingomonas]